MTDLLDGQFELDGVVFGIDAPLEVDTFSPGRAELITQRQKRDSGDGVSMGKDYYGSATWSFRVFTNNLVEDAVTALATYDSLARAWPRESVRLTTGAVAALRYRLGGRTRVVFGRGGRWTPTVDSTLWTGFMAAAGDFETADHLHYADEIQTETISIATPLASGGIIPPFIVPFVSTGVNPARAGKIVIGGDSPTPVWLTFTGPVLNPKVIAPGQWVSEILDTVYPDDPVTVDARPWARSATRQSGGGVKVSPRVTKISQMYLPPGEHTLSFSGIDPTGTARVTVNWRNAYSSL